jgi:Photosynthetic reaction centre cytochrome C subunit
MRFIDAVPLLMLAAGSMACQRQQPQPATPPPGGASPAANQETNDRFVKQISERITGREDEPAEQVFKNIQWLKGVPAGRFLRIMNMGYSRALGVSCTHCHVERDFASDDKRPKRAAREMAAMHRTINEQLKTMKNLETQPDKRAINCSTCHRGAINPMAPAR